MVSFHLAVCRRASSFNGDVSTWPTENVIHFDGMFGFALVFDGNLSAWDTSAAVHMGNMFESADKFTGTGIGAWDTSNVVRMAFIFQGAAAFNADVSAWNVAQVVNLQASFLLATAFSQDLSKWVIRSVTNIRQTFDALPKLTGCQKVALWASWGMQQNNTAFRQTWWMWDPNEGETRCNEETEELPCRVWEKRDAASGTCEPALWLDLGKCIPDILVDSVVLHGGTEGYISMVPGSGCSLPESHGAIQWGHTGKTLQQCQHSCDADANCEAFAYRRHRHVSSCGTFSKSATVFSNLNGLSAAKESGWQCHVKPRLAGKPVVLKSKLNSR